MRYCCDKLRAAIEEFDGPFFVWSVTDELGVALYHLTPGKKAVSTRAGSRRYEKLTFCPWCGRKWIGEAADEQA